MYQSIMLLLLLFAINLYFAWRYAPMDIEPDFALFNMAGQTGAWYGRDFVDCKSPLVHIWFWLLSKIWRSVYGVRFLHFALNGVPGLIYTAMTGDFWGGLAFVILIHSGFLYAFHGNVGDIPAGLILLALTVGSPWLAVGLFAAAVVYEPKLIVAFLPWAILGGYWTQLAAVSGIGLLAAWAIWYFKHEWWEWLVEANWTIPSRMNRNRKGLYDFMPHFTATGLVYAGMWIAAAVIHNPELRFWVPAVSFLLLQFMGRVIRPNHLIPLVGWIAASGMSPAWTIALCSVDVLSAGLYLGDLWARFYPGLRNVIKEAREIGTWLAKKPGTLWVNSMYSEVYIWSGKRPIYGMTEQVEVSTAATERRKKMLSRFARNPADWVVVQRDWPTQFDPTGFQKRAESVFFEIYERIRT